MLKAELGPSQSTRKTSVPVTQISRNRHNAVTSPLLSSATTHIQGVSLYLRLVVCTLAFAPRRRHFVLCTSRSHGRCWLPNENLRKKRYMSRQAARNKSRNRSRIKKLRPLAGVLAMGLSLPLFVGAQSVPYPTYVTGPQPNGSWVVGNGQVLTPAGTQIGRASCRERV